MTLILVSNDDGIHSEGCGRSPTPSRCAGASSWSRPTASRARPATRSPCTGRCASRAGARTVHGRRHPHGLHQPRHERDPARSAPALVISGINKGPNLGDDVTYSGTVSAAMEGTLLGVPSIAVSPERAGGRTTSRSRRRSPGSWWGLVLGPTAGGYIAQRERPERERPGGVALTRMGKRRYKPSVSRRSIRAGGSTTGSAARSCRFEEGGHGLRRRLAEAASR